LQAALMDKFPYGGRVAIPPFGQCPGAEDFHAALNPSMTARPIASTT
jgi:hypothetical protein